MISSYLNQYSDAKYWPLPPQNFSWDHFVFIPARREGEELFEALKSFERVDSKSQLVVIVINSNPSADENEFEAHRDLIKKIKTQYLELWHQREFSLLQANNFKLLIADFGSSQNRCHSKMNVGLARKMAADVAVHLYAQGQLRHPWIHSTDADVIIPKNYFSFPKSEKFSAYHYRYRHRFNEDARLREASIFYEIFLRYHRLGLKFSSSPYAHPSIGSCLCIQIPFYVKVRGFPARDAGEDFYLLNKLRKLAPIDWSPAEPLSILARPEIRCVFGTAAGIQQILHDGFLLDDPQIFSRLKNYRERLMIAAENFPQTDFEFEDALRNSIQQFKSPDHRKHHVIEFFDGLRELQWIRRLRTRELPRQAWSQALQNSAFLGGFSATSPQESLAQLQKFDEESL